jgi:hypothetical protein
MEHELTEASMVTVQEIIVKHINEALNECLQKTNTKATIAFSLPALSKAIGGILATSTSEKGMEDGLELCVAEIRNSMYFAYELSPKGMVQ